MATHAAATVHLATGVSEGGGCCRCCSWRLVAVAVAIGGLMALSVVLSSNAALKQRAVEAALFMQSNPLQGALLHNVLSVAVTVSGVPFALVDLAAGAVYPFPQAVAMLFTAKTVAAACCYLLARTMLPKSTQQSLLANPTVQRINKLVCRSPLYFGTLGRLAVMPTVVKNYGLALLDINFWHYVACCMLGSVVYVPLQAYMGSTVGAVSIGLVTAEAAAEVDMNVAAVGSLVGLGSLLLVGRSVVPTLLAKAEKEGANESKES